MVRPLRMEHPSAIYHVTARGNGRQRLSQQPDDYQRLLDGLEQTIERTDWEMLAFIWVPRVSNLPPRAEKALADAAKLKKAIPAINRETLKTENRV